MLSVTSVNSGVILRVILSVILKSRLQLQEKKDDMRQGEPTIDKLQEQHVPFYNGHKLEWT